MFLVILPDAGAISTSAEFLFLCLGDASIDFARGEGNIESSSSEDNDDDDDDDSGLGTKGKYSFYYIFTSCQTCLCYMY